ncbi:hypothetical protein [Methylobacterium dankookense]|uniref:DNA circulation N-terminal domain-containing protein n=1 Tax=Methylobacterium dankookense TaxID=560405 RepID=A0A564G6I8_9HYPH|nr:hypothetical protein [Methylobacterium dankookense]GJD58349.1 hypothetical protein IFDJLNFL_4268 [Methylobacterium dankookense]VUF15646.1 hypothetical protein MTDSW087_05390 [Methylobacterium dankookense]
MTPAERRQGADVLVSVLDALRGAGIPGGGQASADFRRTVGVLEAGAAGYVEGGTFGALLADGFSAATEAGATFDGMERVGHVAASFTSALWVVQWVAQTSLRLAFVEMCGILAATTFASRQDVDAAKARLNALFAPAEEFAADQRDATVYRSLVALHAAAVRDLTERSRQTPRVITYSLPNRSPALALANRLYGDGGRADELIAENKVVHPLFVPRQGRALAV